MMSKRPLRSPLVALLAAGSLVVVACSAASDPEGSPLSHRSSGSVPSSSTSDGTGSTSTGSTGSTPSTGATGTSNGDTGSGSTSTPTTGTGSSSSSPSTASGNEDAGSTGTTAAPASPSYDIAVDNAAPSLNLADEVVLNVTVTSKNNWTGSVALTAASLPTDVTGAFDNATLQLTAATPATAKLTLKSLSTSVAAATPFTVSGTVGAVAMNAAVTLTVKPTLTISIPVNVDTLKPGFGTINIKAPADIATTPVTILFKNLDSTPHEIHASNPVQGFEHGKGTFAQDQEDTPRNVTVAGTYKFYLHDENNPTENPGEIVIQ